MRSERSNRPHGEETRMIGRVVHGQAGVPEEGRSRAETWIIGECLELPEVGSIPELLCIESYTRGVHSREDLEDVSIVRVGREDFDDELIVKNPLSHVSRQSIKWESGDLCVVSA